ncbi:MAG: SDR family oxidoreductase [Actinomycetota bacterium]
MAGKVVIVTGGARGQGAAAARLIARAGGHVVATDIQEPAEPLSAEGDGAGRITFLTADVTKADDWVRVVEECRLIFGRLDGLVNNAGISSRLGIADTQPDEWDRVLRVNLDSVYLGTKYVTPLIRDSGGGSIVNVSSIAGLVGYTAAAYAASKWAVRGLTKVAAMEFAEDLIRVNSVHPGLIHTPMIDNAPASMLKAFTSMTPLGRGAAEDEVAGTILYLLSDLSSFTSGAEIAVDGGLTAGGSMRWIWKEVERATGRRRMEL